MLVEDKYLSRASTYLLDTSPFSSHDTPDETALETFSTNLFCPFSFVSIIEYTPGAGLLPLRKPSISFFLLQRVSIDHEITSI